MAKKQANVNGYVIENNIPMPVRAARSHGVTEVMRRMQPGQSVLLPQYKTTLSAGAARMAARLLGPEGYQFTMRTVEGGVRIWRTS